MEFDDHDSLCPWNDDNGDAWAYYSPPPCRCELIAKVRESEKAAAVRRVEALDLGAPGMVMTVMQGHYLREDAVIAAIKGDSDE
jgi:hypothetical protein